MHPATYRKAINEAIKPYGLKVQACAHNGGYSYFIDLKTGNQIGQSVMVYRQSQLKIEGWIWEAKQANDSRR